MTSYATMRLGEIMVNRAGTVTPKRFPDEIFDLYSIPAYDEGAPVATRGSEIGSAKQVVKPGDILLSKIVPHIRRAWVVEPSYSGNRLIASGEWMIFRSSNVCSSYLRRVLLSDRFHARLMNTVAGVGGSLLRARPSVVAQVDVPIPSLEEQRSIAWLLDDADALRAKRRAAIALLDDLTQSIFFDMFGSPETNPRGWQVRSFGELLEESPRNGLSPSKGGGVRAKVLTLSAITGSRFDESAVKTSTFNVAPPRKQSVNKLDFLVCRGNGNRKLVGTGFFPSKDMADVTFPDTMIAARVDPRRVTPEFLESVWRMASVRRQIEKAARTTNGTFKINQKALEGIVLAVPPIADQQHFASVVRAIDQARASQSGHLRTLDELFRSLQQRAFRGELWND